MATKPDYEDLLARSATIRNETAPLANTAPRVGSVLEDLTKALQYEDGRGHLESIIAPRGGAPIEYTFTPDATNANCIWFNIGGLSAQYIANYSGTPGKGRNVVLLTYTPPTNAPLSVNGGKISLSISTAGGLSTAADGLQIADKAITHTKIADGTISNMNMGQDAVGTGNIKNNSISRFKLMDGAVTTPKLAEAAVTDMKLASAAVGEGNLKDAAVTHRKLGGWCVTANKIQDGAVTNTKIAASAVWMEHIADGNVTTSKLAASAVTEAKIGAGAVTAAQLAPNAVTDTKISANAVTGAKIKDGAVTGAKIAAKSIGAKHVLRNVIEDADKLFSLSLDNSHAEIQAALGAGYTIGSNQGPDQCTLLDDAYLNGFMPRDKKTGGLVQVEWVGGTYRLTQLCNRGANYAPQIRTICLQAKTGAGPDGGYGWTVNGKGRTVEL